MKPRRARRDGAVPAAFSSRWLAHRLEQLAGPLRGASLCIAFSGGADSTALLVATAALRRRCAVRALHVNHHLQSGANAWARAALRVARGLQVPCTVLQAPVRPARGESVEAAARTARYRALHAALRPGEWLLLAQHQDDQLETVLLQLLRGAGVAGLAAMPAAAGPLLRPLLPLSRQQLQRYLARRGVAWSEDPSNQDERFDRNYLRRSVVPQLLARWPAAGATVSRSALLAAEAQQLLEAQADAQLADARDGPALQVRVLRRLALPQRRNLLRRWLQLGALPLPDQARLQEIAGPMLAARHDAQPLVQWPGGLVRRHGALLYAAASATAPAPTPVSAPAASAGPLRWSWRRESCLALPGGGSLELRPDLHGKLSLALLPDEVEVRYRAGGERLAGRHGGQALKRLLQQRRLPPWQRDSVPLLYAGARLVAVADWWSEPHLQAAPAAHVAGAEIARARLIWTPPI